MIDSTTMALYAVLIFMGFCVLGIIYCAWWGEKPPELDFEAGRIALGYTKEQYDEVDEIRDECYAETMRQHKQNMLGYSIRRNAHYEGVKQGLVAGAAVGAVLYFGSKSDKK